MRPGERPEIANLPLFSEMQEAQRERIFSGSFLQVFPPQLTLFELGQHPDFLHVLVDGLVELYAHSAGRDTTMRIVEPVTSFILAAVITDQPYLMSARTAVKSRILMIPGEEIRRAFMEDEVFARSIVLELADCYRGMVKAQKDLKLRSGVERLAARLVRLNKESGGGGHFALPCDKRTLAALLGMTPENLSRAFTTLRPYGVETVGNEVRITKLGDLETLAKPHPLIDDGSL